MPGGKGYRLRLVNRAGKVVRTILSATPWEPEWHSSADGEHYSLMWRGDGIRVSPSEEHTVEAEDASLERMVR